MEGCSVTITNGDSNSKSININKNNVGKKSNISHANTTQLNLYFDANGKWYPKKPIVFYLCILNCFVCSTVVCIVCQWEWIKIAWYFPLEIGVKTANIEDFSPRLGKKWSNKCKKKALGVIPIRLDRFHVQNRFTSFVGHNEKKQWAMSRKQNKMEGADEKCAWTKSQSLVAISWKTCNVHFLPRSCCWA